ncbi:MAG: ABC transporter permease subunit [Prosthecobacter sp.]
MTPRTTGICLLVFAVLSAVFWLSGLLVPVFKAPFLGGNVFGFSLLALMVAWGLWLVLRGRNEWQLSPLTLKQLRRFRSMRRGYVSFVLLMVLAGLALLDSLIVGSRALVVKHGGHYYFPFVRGDFLPGKTFGFDSAGEVDYRELQERCRQEKKGDWVVMPLVPYAPKLDAPAIIEVLEMKGDVLHLPGSSRMVDGAAYTVFVTNPEQKRQEFQFRKGVRHGDFRGFNEKGEQVEKGRYDNGKRVAYTDFSGGQAAALEPMAHAEWQRLVYPPSEPSITHRHYAGTNGNGQDVLAMLYGGWQQVLVASALYLPLVFGLGVIVGGGLGYFGGWLDILGQRFIEIWAVLPFLLLVAIISSLISPTLIVLVILIAAFGWMSTTSYLRTAVYKEKARDYVAAARLLGASTPRIIFRQVLPNVIAILVTLAPFEVASVITALAALDFLGFGLPPDQPSWGRLLHEGVDNFAYPWIVSSAFTAMAIVLVLVTFVGEAVREAFDPKKFTTYE